MRFYHELIDYPGDKKIKRVVLEKFLLHTWYLNQEFVTFNLFSKNVSAGEKKKIAQKLLKVRPKVGGYEMGRPSAVRIDLIENQGRDVTLSGSYAIIHLLSNSDLSKMSGKPTVIIN